jgi:hypothetical protein
MGERDGVLPLEASVSMQLQGRVKTLEDEVKSLREVVAMLIEAISAPAPTAQVNVNGPRRMCPHCGVKPNYHLHVINCRGPWQGNGAHPG